MDAPSYSSQMDFVNKLVEFTTSSLSDFQSDLNYTAKFAYTLCGLFALFYVANIVWKSWVDGGKIDLYKCFKPFVIGFFILNFSFFTASIDFVAGQFNNCCKGFVQLMQNRSADLNAKFYERIKTLDGDAIASGEGTTETAKPKADLSEGKEQVQEQDSWESFKENFSFPSGKQLILYIQSATRELFGWVCQFLASLVGVCIALLAFINRCVLSFFGPFIFAISLLPHCEMLLMGWIRKYLTYSMYPCILNIINGIMMGATSVVVTGIEGATDPDSLLGGNGLELYYTNLALICINVVTIFIYMCVPSIAGQIMDAGSNGVGAAVSGAISYATSKAAGSNNKIMGGIATGAKMAGSAAMTGGIGAVASGIVGAAGKVSEHIRGGKDGGESNGNQHKQAKT